MKWTKEAVEYLENNCFHQNGKVLVRDSDIAYQGLIDNKLDELTDLGKSLSILDFGCGTGRQLEINDINIKYPINYIGYDKSKEMIEKAKEKFPSDCFTNDLNEIPDTIIDLLIINDVLQHTEDFDAFKNALEEMLLISNNVIAHCWYEESEKHQVVTLAKEKFHEFFVNPIKLEEYFKSELKEYDFDIIRFSNQKPYKCLVFSLSLKDKIADQVLEGIKESLKTPFSDDQIDQIIEDQK